MVVDERGVAVYLAAGRAGYRSFRSLRLSGPGGRGITYLQGWGQAVTHGRTVYCGRNCFTEEDSLRWDLTGSLRRCVVGDADMEILVWRSEIAAVTGVVQEMFICSSAGREYNRSSGVGE